MKLHRSAGRGITVVGWLGIALVLLGTIIAYRMSDPNGQDFRCYYYPMAARFLHGQNPYILSGDPLHVAEAASGRAPLIVISVCAYPPSTAAALAPLALLPEPVARHVWLTISLCVLYLGVWCAMRVIDPHWTINTRLLLLGCVACAGSVRWSVFQYQAAVMVAGLLGIFLYAELRKRNVLSLLCALLITIKFSLLGPVLLLWLFRRQYRKMAILLVLAVVINVGATARTGFAETYAGWRINMANYANPGSNNYPNTVQNVKYWRSIRYPMEMQPGIAPIPDLSAASDFTQWVFLFSAYTENFVLANRLALLCSLLAMGGLILLWRRQRPNPDDTEFMLRLFAVALTLSLLVSTHIRYDTIILIYAFLIGIHLLRLKALKAEALTLTASCVSVGFIAIAKINILLMSITLATHLRWFIPIYSYGTTVAFLAAFRICWLYRCEADQVAADVEQSAPENIGRREAANRLEMPR
jgi:hypothetical protein